MASKMSGNATLEQKDQLLQWKVIFGIQGKGFADTVGRRVELVEASVVPQEHAPKRLQARVVSEITVEEDMCQGLLHMHGGCTSFLIDVCSTYPGALLDAATGGPGNPGVSKSLNITFHAPALLGTKLRIISTTMAQGARTSTSQAEVWDIENERLVASGVHIKMSPTIKDPILSSKL